MYDELYRLDRRPFAATPNPACFVPVDSIEDARQTVSEALRDGQGIALLTAPAGLGKTVLCYRVAADFQADYGVVLLPNANFPTRRSLLQAILYEMGHPYLRMDEQELRLELQTAVKELRRDREALVLIIDECHLMNARLLEEVRTITHLTENGEALVRVLLCGQLSLEERLTEREFDAINQRVVAHTSLESLTQMESARYITHRLQWAGGSPADTFTPDAMRLICHASDGSPRCLNHLCDHALAAGHTQARQPIDAEIVRTALDDLKQLPLNWNDSGTVTETESIPEDFIETVASPAPAAAFEFGGEEDTVEGDDTDVQPTTAIAPPAAVYEVGADVPSDVKEEPEVIEEIDDRADATEVVEEPLVESETVTEAEVETDIEAEPHIDVDSKAVEDEPTDLQTTAQINGWIEEQLPLLDRYAAIDAGLPPTETEPTPTAEEVPQEVLRREEALLPDVPSVEAAELPIEDIEEIRKLHSPPFEEVGPLERIDAVMPLLDEALESVPNQESEPTEEPVDFAEDEDSDFPDVPQTEAEEVLEEATESAVVIPDETVWDDVPVVESAETTVAASEPVVSEPHRPLPEMTDEAVQTEATDWEREGKNERYRQLFSQLRRRLRGQSE